MPTSAPIKFATRNYAGDPVAFFTGTNLTSVTEVSATPSPAHMIYLVDASGSMYYEIAAMRDLLERLLSAEDFMGNTNTVFTLLSYASSGDLVTHFERASLATILAPQSDAIRSLRNLRARGLTCISQALKAAAALVNPSELTCISLHSDGYANDYSASSERAAMEKVLTTLGDTVVVNSIAYSRYSDFNMLSWVATMGGGNCVLANTVRDVYDTLHDTLKTVTGSVAPAYVVDPDGSDVTIVRIPGIKVVSQWGSNTSLTVRGVPAGTPVQRLSLRRVTAAEYAAAPGEESADAALLFSYAAASASRLNEAKYALVSSRRSDLLNQHYKALTGTQIAAMIEAIRASLDATDGTPPVLSDTFGLSSTETPVLDTLELIRVNTTEIDIQHLRSRYSRRSVPSLQGTRDENGVFIQSPYRARQTGAPTRLSSVDINRANATVNILLSTRQEVVDAVTNTPVGVVAGVNLSDLSGFNNYTVVADGEVVLAEIRANFTQAVPALGVPGPGWHTVSLDTRPVIDFTQASVAEIPLEAVQAIQALTAVKKIASEVQSAFTVGRASKPLSEQDIEALKAYFVTPSLNFSPKTTVPYTDRNTAIENGEIDVRTVYNIVVGTEDLTDASKIASGNAALERYFAVDKGTKIGGFLKTASAVPAQKEAGARMKITGADRVFRPIFDAVFGYGEESVLAQHIGPDLAAATRALFAGKITDEDTKRDVGQTLAREVESAYDALLSSYVTPLVMYIGATGLIPDSLEGITAVSVEDLESRGVDLSKAEKEGTFYRLPNGVLISVYSKTKDTPGPNAAQGDD